MNRLAPLARMFHRAPTAAADPLAVARRSPSSRLDVVSATPSPPSSPSAAPQRRLHALATDLGGTCGLVGLALLFGVACGGGDPVDEENAPITIGAIFDLTGPTSDVGTMYAEAIRDYYDWLNARGGIAGRPVELLWNDYGYDVAKAEQLYSEYVQAGAVMFMGWGTGDTEALRGRIAADRIPFVSASFSHVLGDPSEAPYNFLVGTTYSDQLFILLDHLVAEAEASGGPEPNVALMHHPSPFGLSPWRQGGEEYAKQLGIEMAPHEMARGNTDFSATLTRISESGANWVVFQNTSGPASIVLKNAKDLGLDLRFACLNYCSNEVLVELAGETAEGVLGSILFSPSGDGVDGLADAHEYLASKERSMEGKELLYGQGWTVAGLVTEAIGRAAAEGTVSGEAIHAAFESFDGVGTGGVTVPVTFTPTDHRGVKGMRIFEVRAGGWQPITELLMASGAESTG